MTAAADAARCDALLLELFGQDQFAIKLGLDAMAEAGVRIWSACVVARARSWRA